MSKITSFDEFLWPNKYLLNSCGFWPTESKGLDRLFKHLKIISSIFIVNTLFVPQMLTCIVHWNDITVITEVGSIALEVGQLVFKFFYMLLYKKHFRNVYLRAQEFWLITEDKVERENFEKLAKLARQITIVFFAVGISNVFTFVSASMWLWMISKRQENQTTQVHLPLEVSYFGIDCKKSPNFEIAVFCQTIAMIYCAVGIIGFDATMLTLILHICGQFRLLSTHLKSLDSRRIPQRIRHHQQIIRVATDMRELLSPVIFVQLMSSGIEICLCGYVLMIQDNDSTETAKYVIYTITMFLQLLVWCWPGEMLIQDSTAIGDVICHELTWYRLPATRQRDLALVINRSQKRCCVTALNFQVMSMSRLAEIFNTAASYFALLRSVCNK